MSARVAVRAFAGTAMLLALTGCANAPSRAALAGPQLRLSPSATATGAWQQRLEFRSGDRRIAFDALLEIDADAVRLAAVSLQQVAYTLRWDGASLDETRADWLPDGLRGAWILDDLQLAWWPAEAVRAGLPSGWTLDDTDGERVLEHRGAAVATVRGTDTRFELTHHTRGYVLRVDSVAIEASR